MKACRGGRLLKLSERKAKCLLEAPPQRVLISVHAGHNALMYVRVPWIQIQTGDALPRLAHALQSHLPLPHSICLYVVPFTLLRKQTFLKSSSLVPFYFLHPAWEHVDMPDQVSSISLRATSSVLTQGGHGTAPPANTDLFLVSRQLMWLSLASCTCKCLLWELIFVLKSPGQVSLI